MAVGADGRARPDDGQRGSTAIDFSPGVAIAPEVRTSLIRTGTSKHRLDHATPVTPTGTMTHRVPRCPVMV